MYPILGKNEFDIRNLPANFTGIQIGMSWLQICSIMHLIDKYEIKYFIELGVDRGGIGSILSWRGMIDESFHYTGYEIHPEHVDVGYSTTLDFMVTGDIIPANIYNSDTHIKISLLLEQRKHPKTFLLCDGGDKKRELSMYWDILKPGDIIAAHDYLPEDGEVTDVDLKFLREKPTYQELLPFKDFGLPCFLRI